LASTWLNNILETEPANALVPLKLSDSPAGVFSSNALKPLPNAFRLTVITMNYKF
jgi:hypothetical protein